MTWFLVCAALLSSRAHAQGMISGAKAVAGRAAAATNAHTQAEQNPTPAITPSKTTPVVTTAAPAGAKTTPVAATAAKTTPIAAPAAAKTTPVPAATTKAVAVTAKAAPATKTAAAPPVVSADTEARSISVTQRGIKGEVSLNREVFSYDAGGRRDPFVSLLRNGDLRPMLNDLRLVTVLYDPTGRNSVAVMRDLTTKDQYRVKVGQTLGRMRVAGIEPREILFTIEEIGFSRQVGLVLGDSSRARTQ
ncbi:MAG TPA: hypothetical protein VFA43_09505 [Gemmatimonadaceae bacterium]|nr:hypothetical protein [Gemmatimonadaceae bacterium]